MGLTTLSLCAIIEELSFLSTIFTPFRGDTKMSKQTGNFLSSTTSTPNLLALETIHDFSSAIRMGSSDDNSGKGEKPRVRYVQKSCALCGGRKVPGVTCPTCGGTGTQTHEEEY
jgi:DnaJ-class molecular chaperone